MDSEANDKVMEEEIKSVNEDRGKSKPLELYNYANLDINPNNLFVTPDQIL